MIKEKSLPAKMTGKRQIPRKLRVPPSSPLLTCSDTASGSQTLSSDQLNQQLESEIKAGNLIPTLDLSPTRRTKRYSFENDTRPSQDRWRLPPIRIDSHKASEIDLPSPYEGSNWPCPRAEIPNGLLTSFTISASSELAKNSPEMSLPASPPSVLHVQPPFAPPKSLHYPSSPSASPAPSSHAAFHPGISPLAPRQRKSPLSRPSTAHTESTRHTSCTSCTPLMKSSRLISFPVGRTGSSIDPQGYEHGDRQVSPGEARNNPWSAAESSTFERTGPRQIRPLPSLSVSSAEKRTPHPLPHNREPALEEKSGWDNTDSDSSFEDEEREGLMREKKLRWRSRSDSSRRAGGGRWKDKFLKGGICDGLGGLLCRK